MTAEQLIHQQIPFVRSSDLISKALSTMHQYHVQHLPVVSDGENPEYIGLLDEYALATDSIGATRSIATSNVSLPRFFVHQTAHLYEVIQYLQTNHLSAIAVLNHNEQYMGLITLSSVLSYMAAANSMQEMGGIIVLEMNEYDYVLSEIARIAENNDLKILSLFFIPRPNHHLIDLTLKLNRSDLDTFIAELERHGYEISATYQSNEHERDVADHYSSLMNYLKI